MPKKQKNKKAAAPSKAAATKSAQVAKPQPVSLSNKDLTTLKSVRRMFDQHKYKKGIKAADQLLAKYPNHGETMALKGLLLAQTGKDKEEEGMALIKKGIQLDFSNGEVWHIYGKYYYSRLMYADALKCYSRSLMFKKDDSSNVMKDISYMQMQTRQFDKYYDTRFKMLQQKSIFVNFIGFAVGAHKAGFHDKALYILRTALENFHPGPYEASEIRLYYADILQEKGEQKEALKYLVESEPHIKDTLSYLETRAKLNLALGEPKEARALYEQLLELNPDNYAYHRGICRTYGLDGDKSVAESAASAEDLASLQELYESLQAKSPKSKTLLRIPLSYTPATDPSFRGKLEHYIKHFLVKGIPSLFSDLKTLYVDPAKVAIITQVLDSFLESLRNNLKFSTDSSEETNTPATLFWALFFAAGHHQQLGDLEKALSFCDAAIEHTCTGIDAYVLKGRILRQLGDPLSAFHEMNHARTMDTQDRYLNVTCTKYALRAGEFDEAQDIVALFLKDGNQFDVTKHMNEYQASWYELTKGEALLEKNEYMEALKQFLNVSAHYTSFVKEQMDFHYYCLRKDTLRTYLDMIKWADELRGDLPMRRASIGIVKGGLALLRAETEKVALEKARDEEAKKTMSEKEFKNYEKNKRRAAKKEAAKKEQNDSKAAEDDIKIEEEMLTHMRHLLENCPTVIESQLLGVDVYALKKKVLLALKCLDTAAALDSTDPRVHVATIKVRKLLQNERANWSPLITELVDEFLGSLTSDTLKTGLDLKTTVESANTKYLSENKNSLTTALAVGETWILEGDAKKGVAVVSAALEDMSHPIADVTNAIKFLKAHDETAFATHKSAAHKAFPRAVAFLSQEQVTALKETLDFRHNAYFYKVNPPKAEDPKK